MTKHEAEYFIITLFLTGTALIIGDELFDDGLGYGSHYVIDKTKLDEEEILHLSEEDKKVLMNVANKFTKKFIQRKEILIKKYNQSKNGK